MKQVRIMTTDGKTFEHDRCQVAEIINIGSDAVLHVTVPSISLDAYHMLKNTQFVYIWEQ